MLSLNVLVVAGLAVLGGAVVQGTVGFGLALLAAPVMALADPALVPGTLLLVTSVMSVFSAVRERTDVDWPGLRWALLGRVPGTAIGTAAVLALSARALSLAVAIVVLAAVGLSLLSWRPHPTPGALLAGGLVSGVTGTATSIGGPPLAILYQHSSGPRVRSTLAAYFVVGSALSAASLVLAGRIRGAHVIGALALLPFMALGFLLSGPLRPRVDAGRTRGAVLVLAAASAAVLGLRALFG